MKNDVVTERSAKPPPREAAGGDLGRIQLLGSAQAVSIGGSAMLSAARGDDRDLLLANSKLTRAATVGSLSFFASADGKRYVARFIEIIVFAMLLALIAFSAPTRAQTIAITSVTAAPATIGPGQTVVFTATMTANQNASNYMVLFSLQPPGASPGNNTAQRGFTVTFHADASFIQAYGWTAPMGISPGVYKLTVSVYTPAYRVNLVTKTTLLTVTAASGAAAAPVLFEPPVISGTAQVGMVLASTTGTWTGATSFAYQWAGNKTAIAGAKAATYTPVSSDTGHTLTTTVTATASSGATASATSAPTVPIVAASPGSPPPVASGSVPFVALHTYYISPTGSDSNNGLTAATAWKTPNHSVVCGDVIVAASGSYSAMGSWGTVSNCPSTSGGIDGTGGIYFSVLLCGGADLGSSGCNISTTSSTAIDIAKNNWAVEGWTVTTSGKQRSFQCDATATGTTLVSYQAFINDISFNSQQAYDTDDGGRNHNSPGNGCDYQAVIGMIAQNSAQDPICLGAIDAVGPSHIDTNAGTHIYFYGNFSFAHVNPTCQKSYDTEDYMFDTWDTHNVNYQGVVANNIGFDAIRECVMMTEGTSFTNTPTVKIYNNTCFHDNTATGGDWVDGEIHLGVPKNGSWVFTVINNIAYQPLASSNGGGGLAAMSIANPLTSLTNGGAGNQNVFRASNTSCRATYCNSTFDVMTWGVPATLGTNTFINPAFQNTADLLANRVGAPNCTGFASTTACMGWNAQTSKLTTPSVISDLIATAIGSAPYYSAVAGKGYQLSSTTCAANSDYPKWLKGVVYLYWNGSTLTENAGLVTKPCGL